MSNPNTDPHEFEASAERVRGGQQGAADCPKWRRLRHLHGQDRIRQPREAVTSSSRSTCWVCPDNIFNPHLWYDPRTMPLVATVWRPTSPRLEPAQALISGQ